MTEWKCRARLLVVAKYKPIWGDPVCLKYFDLEFVIGYPYLLFLLTEEETAHHPYRLCVLPAEKSHGWTLL